MEINNNEINDIIPNNRFDLTVDIMDVVNYSLFQNGSSVVREIEIQNPTPEDYENVVIRLDSDLAVFEPAERMITSIRAGEEITLKNFDISIRADVLASMTERIRGRLRVRLVWNEEELASSDLDIDVLPFDQWTGNYYRPELLASFVTPNHPYISDLMRDASGILESWGKTPFLEGYQFDDRDRVKDLAAAAYAAVQKQDIAYASAPAGFEEMGQRIRMVDAVAEQKLGNCMDMTVLYTSLLEAMGLNPLMIVVRGHIFAGVWLVDQTFPDLMQDDPTQLEKRMAPGIREILAVECTLMCRGQTASFETAVQAAADRIHQYINYNYTLDLGRARSEGIRPLPHRLWTGSGYVVVDEKEEKEEETTPEVVAPEDLGVYYDFDSETEPQEATKIRQWENKLLDLSLRNSLINLRLTSTVVPILSLNIGALEDQLDEGEEFGILPRPLMHEKEGTVEVTMENSGRLDVDSRVITNGLAQKRIYSSYSEEDLDKRLTKLYRTARTSLEENGSSTLYLTAGLLKWYEAGAERICHYAPLVLIPIEMYRVSASTGYHFRMRQEEARFNVTLLEFLKRGFKIHIDGLDPLPEDEHGLDMTKIFARVRKAIMHERGWNVIESGFIGNFSFSQFMLWKEIHDHPELLENNKIVRSLIDGALDPDCQYKEVTEEINYFLPVDVDSSQFEAVRMEAAGNSFVLQGPPGTGKSQTITALVSHALMMGETVLFAAEKISALEVVKKRLTALGLEDFCLELHSNKENKLVILKQLSRALEQRKARFDANPDDFGPAFNMTDHLDSYMEKVYGKGRLGKSLKEMIDIYESYQDEDDLYLRYTPESTVTLADIERQKQKLQTLAAAGKELGSISGHPLTQIGLTEYTQTLKMQYLQTVNEFRESLEEFRSETDRFCQLMKKETPATREEWAAFAELAGTVRSLEEVPAFMLSISDPKKEFGKPAMYLQKKNQIASNRGKLLSKWQEIFLEKDTAVYRQRFEEIGRKWIGKNRAYEALQVELQSFAKFPVSLEQFPFLMEEIESYKKKEQALKEMYVQLSPDWQKYLDGVNSLQEVLKYQNLLEKINIPGSSISELLRDPGKSISLEQIKGIAEEWEQAFGHAQECENKTVELLKLKEIKEENDWISDRIGICDRLIESEPLVKDWVVYQKLLEECQQEGLGVFCKAYEEKGLTAEQLMKAFEKAVYREMIMSVFEEDDELNQFSGVTYTEMIRRFKRTHEIIKQEAQKEMIRVLRDQLPDDSESEEISEELTFLRKAILSNGRGVTIRSLFEKIPHILKRLCPCMLMSPISVAQYLPSINDQFDLVVFDEASQIPTCKAVGTLARGKNAIIVGDSMQLPPTMFFMGNAVDEDNLDLEDLDSILEDCKALGMPESTLKWHYRSNHESLIAFSNHVFYDDSLKTFPSANDREKRVRLVKVENGVFDRGAGRINRPEAERVVEEIKRRYQDPETSTQSIGVVTFNIQQQTLVEDLLQVEFMKDSGFDYWANNSVEPMFIKNLESVQGDERDVILFSVSYAPDKEGKFSLNFGPLNKAGGEKRLNVAVTRAREEMVVFSSIHSHMIELKRTQSKGVEALKQFLQYAESGKLGTASHSRKTSEAVGMTAQICQVIQEMGFEYDLSVGRSDFKMDIAVKDPSNESGYVLGILIDGGAGKPSFDGRDREITQMSILKRLGWNLHRIWTLDLWDKREAETKKLKKRLEELSVQSV